MKKKKAAGILALSACMVLGISGSAAADWTPADISEAVGYYSTDEGSLVLMSSGTMYAINAETGEMGTSSYEAYRDGGNLMLVSEEKKAVLVPQKEKGKTESGGSYYAFYQDYEGDASEVEFREGKHVQFGDEIFGNDTDQLNEKAVAVLKIISRKLSGRDFGSSVLEVSQQVDMLIRQATSHENLCQCYVGWCPFW